MKIEAYITKGCTYCSHLKELLFRANLDDDTEWIKVPKHITREDFLKKYPNANGYPYVIIDGVEFAGLVPTAKFLVDKGLIKSGSSMTEEQRAEFTRKHYFSEGQCVD